MAVSIPPVDRTSKRVIAKSPPMPEAPWPRPFSSCHTSEADRLADVVPARVHFQAVQEWPNCIPFRA